jgi:chromate transport protein ChrA
VVFGFDAIVASLVLVLPGFIVVGTVIALAPSWERFSPNPATYVLLSLAASVALHLGFAWLAARNWVDGVKPWFKAFDTFDFSSVARLAFAVAFLKPLFTLLGSSVLLGLAIAGLMRLAVKLKTRGGQGVPSQKTVWRHVFETRTKAPNAVVIMANKAYKGQLRRVTTTDSDPHIYLREVSVMALDPKTGLPDWDHMTSLAMEGLLLKQSDIHEVWLLND